MISLNSWGCLLFALHVNADYNYYKGRAIVNCVPALYVDGTYYCSNEHEGWGGGGEYHTSEADYLCWRNLNEECRCADCGPAGTQCQERRCDDSVGVIDNNGVCSQYTTYTNCYSTYSTCDSCPITQQRVGCARTSAGTCQPCFSTGVPPAGTFFVSTPNNVCKTQQCTPVAPGQWVKTPCSPTADMVPGGCAEYPGKGAVPGNQLSLNNVPGKDFWYCPGNGVISLLPSNSHPINGYSSYACDDGYYQNSAGQCKQCLPGSCCMYGQSFICPAGYYSQDKGNSVCTLCTTSCPVSQLPVLCQQGSTFDQGCVPCGMCGYSEQYGHICMEDSAPFKSMPGICTPTAPSPTPTSPSVAVCQ